jgi:hypothetical protein
MRRAKRCNENPEREFLLRMLSWNGRLDRKRRANPRGQLKPRMTRMYTDKYEMRKGIEIISWRLILSEKIPC